MSIIKLNDNNGLYKFVKNMVKSGLEIYLDNRTGRTSIHVHELIEGINVKQFQLKIANYVGSHMLQDTYKTVSVYIF